MEYGIIEPCRTLVMRVEADEGFQYQHQLCRATAYLCAFTPDLVFLCENGVAIQFDSDECDHVHVIRHGSRCVAWGYCAVNGDEPAEQALGRAIGWMKETTIWLWETHLGIARAAGRTYLGADYRYTLLGRNDRDGGARFLRDLQQRVVPIKPHISGSPEHKIIVSERSLMRLVADGGEQ